MSCHVMSCQSQQSRCERSCSSSLEYSSRSSVILHVTARAAKASESSASPSSDSSAPQPLGEHAMLLPKSRSTSSSSTWRRSSAIPGPTSALATRSALWATPSGSVSMAEASRMLERKSACRAECAQAVAADAARFVAAASSALHPSARAEWSCSLKAARSSSPAALSRSTSARRSRCQAPRPLSVASILSNKLPFELDAP
mmetsp:Transcript_11099/g.27942  ORF Transcript_11099/g.27942 Transcript_11099/m.27942 type:complete len:201 (-) Transcript_11099:553-1155(-)